MIRRSTWILLAVFVVLAGVAIYLMRNPVEQEPEFTAVPTQALLLNYTGAQVSSLSVEAADSRTVTLERDEDGSWQLIEPALEGAIANDATAESAAGQVGSMRVLTTLDADTALDSLGLEQPNYRILYVFDDGQAAVLLIGNATPTASGYYVKLGQGQPRVVSKSPLDFLINMLDAPPAVFPEETPQATP